MAKALLGYVGGQDHHVLADMRRLQGRKETTMPCYAIGILRDVQMGPPIVEYLEGIDTTLAPFGGHFIVRGGKAQILDDTDPGTLIVIEFPDHDRAHRWYASDAHQQILPLRTENSPSTVLLVVGVDRAHKATDVLR